MPDSELLSTSEACSLLGNIEKATLTRWVREGHLDYRYKGSKKNSAYLFDRDVVEQFAADLVELAAAPPADILPGLDVADITAAGGAR
jgi:hypothetical protein